MLLDLAHDGLFDQLRRQRKCLFFSLFRVFVVKLFLESELSQTSVEIVCEKEREKTVLEAGRL